MKLATTARFQLFGTEHVVWLVIFLTGCVVFWQLGRRMRGHASAERLSRLLAVAIACVTVPLQLLQFTPAEWNLDNSLPLQLCDLAWMIAVVALWTHRPQLVTITWLWGVTLTTQAIITPDLVSTFPQPRSLMFWAMHLLIVWSAFFLTPGLEIWPNWRLYRRCVALTLGWAALTYVFNVAVGTNYGFLNHKPGKASALDLLGPWPWYVAGEIAIVAAIWALLTWPFVRAADRRSAVAAVGQ